MTTDRLSRLICCSDVQIKNVTSKRWPLRTANYIYYELKLPTKVICQDYIYYGRSSITSCVFHGYSSSSTTYLTLHWSCFWFTMKGLKIPLWYFKSFHSKSKAWSMQCHICGRGWAISMKNTTCYRASAIIYVILTNYLTDEEGRRGLIPHVVIWLIAMFGILHLIQHRTS